MLDIEIRAWNPSDSVDEITELLHLAYGALARQGMHYNASHQPPSQTFERLSRGKSFLAISEGKIVGTVTLYQGSEESGHPYYQRLGLMYFGQFGVHPDFQGHGIAKKLYTVIEDAARTEGAQEMALDTAETATNLIQMYERWGFQIVDHADWDSTNYVSVIMAKPLLML